MDFVETLIKNFGPTTFTSSKVFFTTSGKFRYRLIKIKEDYIEYISKGERGILRVGTSYKLVGVKRTRTLAGLTTTFLIKWKR